MYAFILCIFVFSVRKRYAEIAYQFSLLYTRTVSSLYITITKQNPLTIAIFLCILLICHVLCLSYIFSCIFEFLRSAVLRNTQ